MSKTIINRLNNLSQSWKAQFDVPFLEWDIEELDSGVTMLTLDKIHICPLDQIIIGEESFDVEYITLVTTDGYIKIVIGWPYEEPARISEIVHHRILK